MIADNLTTLFTPAADGVRFRQGTVLDWNADTGENTIDLAGGILTDVPILNTGEAVALKAGHVVGLLGQGSAWFIIGRVTPPNSADFAGASVAFGNVNLTTTNWAPTTGGTFVIDSAPIAIPDWADEALVMATVNARVVNTRTVADTVSLSPLITTTFGGGAYGSETAATLAASNNGALTNSQSRLLTGFDPTAEDVTVTVLVRTLGANWATHVSNTAILSAIAIFRSTV